MAIKEKEINEMRKERGEEVVTWKGLGPDSQKKLWEEVRVQQRSNVLYQRNKLHRVQTRINVDANMEVCLFCLLCYGSISRCHATFGL